MYNKIRLQTKMQVIIFLCSIIFFATAFSQASDLPLNFEWSIASLPQDNQAQKQVVAVLELKPDPDWYFYSPDPGPDAMPTRIDAVLMPAAKALDTFYPPAREKQDVTYPDLIVKAYEGKTPFFVPFQKAETGPDHLIQADIKLLLCTTGKCRLVDTSTKLKLDNIDLQQLPKAQNQAWWDKWQAAAPLKKDAANIKNIVQNQSNEALEPVLEPALESDDTKSKSFEEFGFNPRYFSAHMEVKGLAKAIFLAILAGLILNFMPCVLPVISLKLKSFFPSFDPKDIKKHKKRFQIHNLFFALGILLYFLVLALIIALTGMAWGQVFQNPVAVLILTTIVFILSLSLLDVFHLPIIDLKASRQQSSNYKLEALSTGILATLLATPCSGPFLGGVLAWGLLQPPLVIAIVLSCVGLGMALPYLLMVIYPSLVHLFTRTGKWMIYLERIVAFLLIATCIYLISLLPAQYYLKALILLWTAGLSAWIWGQWTNLNQSRKRRWTIRSFSILLILIAGIYAASPPPPPDHLWQKFNTRTFKQQLGQKPLLLEFTANWCPNCKLLEKTVLKKKTIKELVDKYSIQPIQVDLSYESPEAMNLLKELGSQSIPLVAIFPPGKQSMSPVVLRDLFSREDLQMAVDRVLE